MQEITHSQKMKLAVKASKKLNPQDVEKLCMSVWGRKYRKELKNILNVTDARISQIFNSRGGGYLLHEINRIAKEQKKIS